MLDKIVREALPENPSLEVVVKSEIEHLEAQHSAHTNEAGKFRQRANQLKELLRSAGITVK